MSASAEQWIAAGTWVLAVGVFFAWASWRSQRRASRVTESGHLIHEWNGETLRYQRRILDNSVDIEECRRLALHYFNNDDEGYAHDFEHQIPQYLPFINNTADEAERIEAYIRNGVADETLIAELLAYDVIATYYFLQDVLKIRAKEEDINYEGFRNLTLRLQDRARLSPRAVDIRDELRWYSFPRLEYRVQGDFSTDYNRSPWRRLRLAFCRMQRTISARKTPLADAHPMDAPTPSDEG